MAEATKTASLDAGYATRGLPPPPQISVTTIPMAGLLVDVYGLEELRPSVPVSCLWLLHPRTRTRARMRDIASRVVGAYNNNSNNDDDGRGLVALAFDMPNHGTRVVSEAANSAWDEGNERHAVDMMGMIKGGRSDMSGLMDVVEGYLEREVGGHACLGWSLGGHAAWQGWIREERLDAVVVVVGCPDFPGLMRDRAKLANLPCGDDGGDVLGSKYFPPCLLRTCAANDPKTILFGESPLPSSSLSLATEEERARLRALVDRHVGGKGKKLLLLSGGADVLVPYANTEAFARALGDLGVDVRDEVFAGVGHSFAAPMVERAVEFLVGSFGERVAEAAAVGKDGNRARM
ncbi:hypothetical protein N3K66_005113 [Trichothecium roseum]|uniref:Uncharacterized protein n=1 Tax=Trichothecium roseum TaxID=47278 RepID=A0ACC0V3X4_9HYPO|nr:hypothetical protein N3K66_005113 [Trichothecium roseum]